jgi:integrase
MKMDPQQQRLRLEHDANRVIRTLSALHLPHEFGRWLAENRDVKVCVDNPDGQLVPRPDAYDHDRLSFPLSDALAADLKRKHGEPLLIRYIVVFLGPALASMSLSSAQRYIFHLVGIVSEVLCKRMELPPRSFALCHDVGAFATVLALPARVLTHRLAREFIELRLAAVERLPVARRPGALNTTNCHLRDVQNIFQRRRRPVYALQGLDLSDEVLGFAETAAIAVEKTPPTFGLTTRQFDRLLKDLPALALECFGAFNCALAGLYYGCRPGEARLLQRDDLVRTATQGLAQVSPTQGREIKNDRARRAPGEQKVHVLLERVSRGCTVLVGHSRAERWQAYRALLLFLARHGVKGPRRGHWMRGVYATCLVKRLGIEAARQALAHLSADTTYRHYIYLDMPDECHELYRRADFARSMTQKNCQLELMIREEKRSQDRR